jgi:uncharacterized protein (TIGR00661 family)
MRILYGIVGEGMGHAVRSRVILEYLWRQGHELLVVSSGRAHGFLTEHFAGRRAVQVERIHGLHLTFEGSALDLRDSVVENLEELPASLATNFDAYRRVVESHFRPEVAFSDFDSWAYAYGRRHGIPVISVDNLQMLDRCQHERAIVADARFDFNVARMAVRVKLPRAYHYLVSSFFFPPIRRPRTTLVPPILRSEVLALRRERGDHVLVYQTSSSNEGLVPLLKTLPYEFRVYGMGRESEEDNVSLRAFSESTFLDDLRTARALIAGGGFTLMSEAVHLGVPMLTVPPERYSEQRLNGRYLAELGYGMFADRLNARKVEKFLTRTSEFEDALKDYPAQDNRYLFQCIEELLDHIQRKHAPPVALSAAAVRAIAGKSKVES